MDSDPPLIILPCYLCYQILHIIKLIWPTTSVVCVAHDQMTWMSCDHYVSQQEAMFTLIRHLAPNMTDTVFFYDGKTGEISSRSDKMRLDPHFNRLNEVEINVVLKASRLLTFNRSSFTDNSPISAHKQNYPPTLG